MKSVPLTAYPRTLSRRAGAKKLRESGRIPAVLYGGKTQPQNLEVDRKSIQDLIHHSASETLLIDLTVDKDDKAKRLALVKEVQHYALTGALLHIDFQEISATDTIVVVVPIESVGEAIGIKTGGGILEHVLHKIKIRCLPKNLPEAIVVDVSALEIGHSIHIGDIKAPEGVEIIGDKHISVLALKAPITEAEETAADATATTTGEVEMIKEKKEEGEGAAKAPAAAAKSPAAAGAKADEKKPAEKKPAEKKK